ncbi:hypothetical protein Droror1_Dr00025265 [Drosera rotundifolia]
MILLILLFLSLATPFPTNSDQTHQPNLKPNSRQVIQVEGSPDSVAWVVQLSDTHFSVHHPDRARDFAELIGPALRVVRPDLVFVTGDLTDAKSQDMLIMKQGEQEWIEYQSVMREVVKRSGLDKSIFYDLRGNHDNFGVPAAGGPLDFFSKYSLNAGVGRSAAVNSVTLETSDRRYLFVGIDTTMAVGLRGPTNLFGHPTDELLAEVDPELSQWDSEPNKPVTKVIYGHFPLSFSRAAQSGRTLKDVFHKHSTSAYICGHLHTRLGKNMKRHHQSGNPLFQLDMHRKPQGSNVNCSHGAQKSQDFWEWEMGDWRKSRMMRILAIDRGHISFVDFNFTSGAKKTFIVPTFPLDSRLMLTRSMLHDCKSMDTSSYMTIRALVFSVLPIQKVLARVYDSRPGDLVKVMEATMEKHSGPSSRGDLYSIPWFYESYMDKSPVRYWFQIEAFDIKGQSTLSDLRPFSVNGVSGTVSWTWKEFLVLGCQWDALYYPLFWLFIGFGISILLLPIVVPIFSKKQYSLRNFCNEKGVVNGILWVLTELYGLRLLWFGLLGYLFSLVLFPWFSGQVFIENGERLYMTFRGWVMKHPGEGKKIEFIGIPDVIVVVIPHLFFIVLPTIWAVAALVAERRASRSHFLALCGKKQDDGDKIRKNSGFSTHVGRRWTRKFLIAICVVVLLKHFQSCRHLAIAYEMNPFLQFPVYSFAIPVLLLYAIYKTSGIR